ncbi:MAG: hypothetical protein ACTHWZ_06655 [Peptoniphilaceae bacterium]
MKKFLISILSISIFFTLVGSSSLIDKGIVKSYKLGKDDKLILNLLNLEREAKIMSFKPPKKAKKLLLTLSKLNKDGNWETISDTEVSLDKKWGIKEEEGYLSILIKEDKSLIEASILTDSKFTINLQSHINDNNVLASAKLFLDDSTRIEINKDLPVGIFLYNKGNFIPAYSLSNYFDTERFKNISYVEAISLKFL